MGERGIVNDYVGQDIRFFLRREPFSSYEPLCLCDQQSLNTEFAETLRVL